MLRRKGFETTDSGDGVSKPPAGRVFDVPHVVAVTTHERLIDDAIAMKQQLDWLEFGAWRVEASYCPNDGSCLLLATKNR